MVRVSCVLLIFVLFSSVMASGEDQTLGDLKFKNLLDEVYKGQTVEERKQKFLEIIWPEIVEFFPKTVPVTGIVISGGIGLGCVQIKIKDIVICVTSCKVYPKLRGFKRLDRLKFPFLGDEEHTDVALEVSFDMGVVEFSVAFNWRLTEDESKLLYLFSNDEKMTLKLKIPNLLHDRNTIKPECLVTIDNIEVTRLNTPRNYEYQPKIGKQYWDYAGKKKNIQKYLTWGMLHSVHNKVENKKSWICLAEKLQTTDRNHETYLKDLRYAETKHHNYLYCERKFGKQIFAEP